VTPLDLQAIRARIDLATPGPWSEDDGNIGSEPLAEARQAIILRRLRGETGLPHPDDGLKSPLGFVASTHQEQPNFEADAEFIAHARTDVPALCDALETATKRAADWREKAEELAACALRIIEERDAARGLSIEAALMLRRVGPVGNEYCLVCGDGHTEDCAFVALLARLEAPR
jgi:hypothetical protein